MDLSQYLDLYCERTGPGLLGEPLNLLSNSAFLVAGAAAWRNLRDNPLRGPAARWQGPAVVACMLMLLVGIGSATFHGMATVGSQLADVIPIGIFVFYFLILYGLIILGRGWRGVMMALVGMAAAGGIFHGLIDPAWVNGSQDYFAPLLLLVVLAALHYRQHAPSGRIMLVASGVFALSLIMRSVDLAVCDWLPMGTHWLWHGLNGLLLYLLMAGLTGFLRQQKRNYL